LTLSRDPVAEAAAAADPVAPALLRLGRFEVRRFLGEGAFGRVYEGFDPVLQRVVALKVAKPEQLHTPRRVERFLREARAAAHLLHPHIVPVFDSGSDGPHHYIASAFIPGQSLGDALHTLPPGQTLGARRSAELVRQLAEALAYAHRQGVVHRDVKPANVLLRQPDGDALLTDFGLAVRAEEERLTLEGQPVGTPAYMAPEQAAGQASATGDQYSLGCVLYELLTGRPPFSGGTALHILWLHQSQPPMAPRSLAAEVPEELEAICLKCLEKEPGQRYADCEELAEDLRRWLEGEPVRSATCGSATSLGRETVGGPTAGQVPILQTPAPKPTRWRIPMLLGLVLVGGISTALFYHARDRREKTGSHPAQVTDESATQEPGSSSVPVANSILPAATTPRLLDDLPRGQRHPLLDRPPFQAVWNPGDRLASWQFDPDRRSLFVNSPHSALSQLGELHSRSFIFEVQINQPRWNQGAGVYFGYRIPPGSTKPVFQYLMLANGRGGKPGFSVQRGTGRVEQVRGSPDVPLHRKTSEDVKAPWLQQAQLIVEVTDRRLARVHVQGEELKKLVEINGSFTESDYEGCIGLFNDTNACGFDRVFLTILPDR
jgi:serine/threonine protein kinase